MLLRMRSLPAVAASFVLFLCHSLSLAGDTGTSSLRFETYAGGDYSSRAASLWTSTVWSALGPITEPGLRLKLDGIGNVYGDTSAAVFSSAFLAADLKALGDVMVGYQLNRGSLWVKVYAGAAYQGQARIIYEAGQIIQQQNWGAVGSVETFWRLNDRIWTSVNVSLLQIDLTTSMFSRAAYEIFQGENGLRLSIGAEGGATASNANLFREGKRLDLYNDYLKGGGLINLRYGTHDLSLSGGLSQASDEAAWRPYISLSYGKKF